MFALDVEAKVDDIAVLDDVLLALKPELSRRQFEFLMDSLRELDVALQARGSRLMVRTGEATEVLSALHRQYGLDAVHAHEEVGLQWAFGRDRAVYRWARNAGVSMREQPILPPGRESWSVRWDRRMAEPRGKAPEQIRSPALTAPDWPLPCDSQDR